MSNILRLTKLTFFVSVLLFCISARSVREIPSTEPNFVFDEKNKDHWNFQAQWILKNKISSPLNTKVAKNVILFLGDGMSITTLAATRVYLGQKYGNLGEEVRLSFEIFPYTGLAKTYCVDHNVADSACSGTAYFTGVKANSGTLGLSGAVKRGDCKSQRDGIHSVTGLVDWAQRQGKATDPKNFVAPFMIRNNDYCKTTLDSIAQCYKAQFARSRHFSIDVKLPQTQVFELSWGVQRKSVVTTTRVTHASPAASYAHSADRKWESDSDLPKVGLQCEDIASQLVKGKVGSKINVVLGGGRKNFFPKQETDVEGVHGHRSDNRNLIREWLFSKRSYGVPAKYIYNRHGLLTLEPIFTNVLGLFSPDHMPYHLEAEDDDPTLSEMTEKAIQILSSNPKGYFLFVEGGRIDTAHHETKARKALDETAEFAKAVEQALNMVDPEETLIVVTSDHSHTMTYSGYSKRGSDILGFSNKANASDSLPYTTLSYANGPGYKPHENFKRQNLILNDLKSLNFTYPSLVPIHRETHGGEDVAVFAKGPWAHIFSGNYEQNFIPHAIAYAACIGPGLTSCKV